MLSSRVTPAGDILFSRRRPVRGRGHTATNILFDLPLSVAKNSVCVVSVILDLAAESLDVALDAGEGFG